MILVLQVIFLTLCGPAIKVVQWGLDPYGWAICIAFGVGGWIFGAFSKFIPLQNILSGSGKEEITKEELNRGSTLSIRKKHDEDFFKRRESMNVRKSFVDTDGRRGSVTKRPSISMNK